MARGVDKTFDVLLKSKGEFPREVLLSALDEPDAHIQVRSVSALTLLHAERGIPAILDAFDRLPRQARAEVVADHERFVPAIRSTLRTGRVGERENALAILDTVGKPRHASIVAGALSDGAPEIRARAAAILRAMAVRLHATLRRSRPGAGLPWSVQGTLRELLTALRIGMNSYDLHREQGVIEAFLLLGDESQQEMLGRVEAGSAELANDFVATLKRNIGSLDAGLFIKCLLSESLKVKAAARQVLSGNTEEKFAANLEQYLDTMMAQSRLALSDDDGAAGWWEIAVERLNSLGEPFQIKLLRLAVSYLKGESCIRWLADLSASRFSNVRKEIILAASEESCDAARKLIEAMLTDRDESVQLLATQEVMVLGAEQKMEPLLLQLNSPFESVRNLAASEVSNTGFRRYLAGFDDLDEATRRKAGSALAKLDSGIVQRLTDELTALEPERRTRALRIVQAIRKTSDLSGDIMRLVADQDKKVRATAVILLGAIGSSEALQAMIDALSDPDPRVQANAIEAFEELDQPDFADILLPFVRSRDNRIRANAIKALWHLKHPDAARHLLAMISEPSERMRLSAVWLLGKIRIPETMAVLKKLAVADTSVLVRQRARELLEVGAA